MRKKSTVIVHIVVHCERNPLMVSHEDYVETTITYYIVTGILVTQISMWLTAFGIATVIY